MYACFHCIVYSEQNDVITLCSSLFNSKVSNEQILRNNNWQFQNWKRLIRHPLHELFLRSSHRAERFPRDHYVANSETAVPLFVERLHATVSAITDWARKCFMTLSFICLSVKLFNKITLTSYTKQPLFYFHHWLHRNKSEINIKLNSVKLHVCGEKLIRNEVFSVTRWVANI